MDPLATTVLYIGHEAAAPALKAALDTASRTGGQRFKLAHAPVDTPEGLERLAAGGVDVVLVDAAASLEGAMDALVRARIEAPDVPVVVLAGATQTEAAVAQALESGAQDWLAREPLDGALLARVLRYAIERERLQSTLRQLSLTDELTGLYNRRGFFLLADHHLHLAHRTRGLLLASMEVPTLKQITEEFGREEAERADVAVCTVLRDTFRASDVIARMRTGEFAALVVDAAGETEDVIAPRLRARVKRHNKDHPQARAPLALAIGIARHDTAAPPIAADLLARAESQRVPAR
jgi:two-component system cell cycle response regulator